MSKLFVDEIVHQSSQGSGTITLGASGETVALAAGATQSGFGGTNTPAFEATLSGGNQTISDNVQTKVQFNNEVFDTDGKYDNSTNYRFTPGVAGKYFVYLVIGTNSLANANLQNMYSMIFKNGSFIKTSHFNFASNNAQFATGTANAVVTMDADDYIEAFVQMADSSGEGNVTDDEYSTFGAYRIIE